MIDVNPVKQIVTKKTAPYEYYIYSREEFNKLLSAFNNDRDIILILLGGVCGLRLSEVFGL
jgi:integrase